MRNPALSLKTTVLSAVAAVVLMCAIASAPALADDEVIHYMDKDGNACEIAKSEVIDITNFTGTPTLQDGKTYIISEDMVDYENSREDKRMRVKGSATLIIARGVCFASTCGIRCSEGNSLTIAGQLDHPELAKGVFKSRDKRPPITDDAFIGGDEDETAGEIAICGCDVEVYGCDGGAAIGGGQCGDGGKIIIRDADVHAEGASTASAIGGGGAGFIDDAGDGGDVLIVDSTVTAIATGDNGGAGIGGGGDNWCNAGDQGDGGKVTIEGDSVVEAWGGDGAAIGRGDDEGEVGTVILDNHLKVTDLSKNKGKIASAAEREGYCVYRNHVRIEPCDHQDMMFDTSPSAHKYMCPHCLSYPEAVLFHEFGEDGNCKTCGYHADRPFFVAPEMGEGDQDYVVFWFDINGLDEATFEASYIDIEVCDEGTETLKRRDKLSQWGERRGDLRSYATWVLDDVPDDALVIATVHYGKDQTVCQSAELGDLRAAAREGATEAQ